MHPITRVKTLLPLFFTLAACGGGNGGGNDDPPPQGSGTITVSVGNAAAAEGDSGAADILFTVSLSAAAGSAVTVDYASADGSADQNDYTAVSGQLTIAAGQTSATIAVSVAGDTDIELDEDFTLGLTNPVNASLGNAVGVGQIENDDFPFLTVSDASVTEGNSGSTTLTFDVTLDRPGLGDITVDYASSDVAAIAGQDYTTVSGTLTINEGDTAAVIDVDITPETIIEVDEQFIVNLLNASPNARVADDEAFGLIINDDFPRVSIGPASVTELDVGVRILAMPLTLDAAATADITVSFETTDATATAGDDYTAVSGSVTVPAGDVTATIAVDTLGDTDVESSESFLVTLTAVQGPAVLDQVSASGTILDNDGPPAGPQLSSASTSVVEGDSGTTLMSFNVILDQVLTDDTNFDYATADATASAGVDYLAISGSATIPAGSTSVMVNVTVNGDTDEEDDESLLLLLSNPSAGVTIFTASATGTILDDDTPVQVPSRVTISDVAVIEGDTGTVALDFAVTLDVASADPITAAYFTEESTALEGVDYQGATGTISFAPGEVATTITVQAIGDTSSEDDEAFRVRLNNLTGDATFARSSGIGTILTDEPLVRLSIADTGSEEGDAGSSDQLFTVSLDIVAASVVSFDFATADDSATAGDDYVAASGSLQILPGDLSVDIAVAVNGDTDNEPDEAYTMTLSSVSANAAVTNTVAIGTIVNDDGTPGWQAPQVIGNGNDDPSVDMDSAGNAAAVFTGPTDPVTFNNPVLVAQLSGGVWQTPIELGLSRRVPSRQPRIAMLGGADIVAAWVSATAVESSIFTAGGAWADADVAADGGFFLELDANESGEAIAAWEGMGDNFDPSDIHRNYLDPAVGSWGVADVAETDDTGNALTPLAAIDEDGNRFLHWYQNFSNTALSGPYFNFYDAAGGAWTGPTPVPELLFASNEQVGFLGGRPAVVAQMRGFAGNEDSVELWIYDPGSSTWISAGAVETSAESSVLPEFAADANGNIFVAWLQQPASGNFDVYVNRFDASSNAWGVPVPLESVPGTVWPNDGGLDIAVGGDGNAIVVWSQNIAPTGGFDYRIRASRYTIADGLWSPAEQIDDGTRAFSAFGPDIAMDARGDAVVVWFYDGASEVGAARYIAP